MPWAEELKEWEKIYNSLFINRKYQHKYDSQNQLTSTVAENQMLALQSAKEAGWLFNASISPCVMISPLLWIASFLVSETAPSGSMFSTENFQTKIY